MLLEDDELPDELEEPDEPDELEPDELLEKVFEGVLLDLPCESKYYVVPSIVLEVFTMYSPFS